MRILFILLSLLGASFSFSQVIWTEDFSAGSAARGTSAVGYPASAGGTWSQTITGAEGGSANQWYVSGEECGNAVGNCGSACSNADASLHISAIGGLCGTPDCGAAYNESGVANATDRRIESPNINTVGYGGLTLDYGYIAAQGDDNFRVEYSCDGGATWNILTTPAASQCCSCLDAFICGFIGLCCPPQTQQACTGGEQGFWTSGSIALPVCAENIANLRIGFHWANDGNGIGTDPSVAIDDITVTASVVLPVELVNVAAQESDFGNEVTWTTLSELNNSHFIIEHRSESNEFTPVGRVEGNGTTTTESNYRWVHESVKTGDNYYRLKQVDFDGHYEYSQTLLVRNNLNEKKRMMLYPNPASSKVSVQYFSNKESEARFAIVDISGRIIFEKEQMILKGKNNCPVDISTLDKGQYLFTVVMDGEKTVQSFVKK
ncbi:MAG: T9SS type A sorting domain-containing protein [Fluviicola sp.]